MNLGSTVRWYYRVPFVLLMLFVVMGPFALPMLWKSPQFSRQAKWILTVLTLIFTVWLVWKIFETSQKILSQFPTYAAR